LSINNIADIKRKFLIYKHMMYNKIRLYLIKILLDSVIEKITHRFTNTGGLFWLITML